MIKQVKKEYPDDVEIKVKHSKGLMNSSLTITLQYQEIHYSKNRNALHLYYCDFACQRFIFGGRCLSSV